MYPIEALKNTVEHMTDDAKVQYISDTIKACRQTLYGIYDQKVKSKFAVGDMVYMNNGNLFIGVLKEIDGSYVDVKWDNYNHTMSYNYEYIDAFDHSVLSTLLPVGSKVVMAGDFPGAKEWFKYGNTSFGKANWVKIVGYDGIRVRVKLDDGSELVAVSHSLHLDSIKQENS